MQTPALCPPKLGKMPSSQTLRPNAPKPNLSHGKRTLCGKVFAKAYVRELILNEFFFACAGGPRAPLRLGAPSGIFSHVFDHHVDSIFDLAAPKGLRKLRLHVLGLVVLASSWTGPLLAPDVCLLLLLLLCPPWVGEGQSTRVVSKVPGSSALTCILLRPGWPGPCKGLLGALYILGPPHLTARGLH